MALSQVAEAVAIVRKREAERAAERAATLAAAEELCRRCALGEAVEEPAGQKLADAMELLGVNPGVWQTEADMTQTLPARLRELDEIEVNYRAAVAELAEAEAHYRAHPVAEGSTAEDRIKSHLQQLESATVHFKQLHGSRQLMLTQQMKTLRYPRALPPRYRVPLEYLVENYHPSVMDETGKLIPGEPFVTHPRKDEQRELMSGSDQEVAQGHTI